MNRAKPTVPAVVVAQVQPPATAAAPQPESAAAVQPPPAEPEPGPIAAPKKANRPPQPAPRQARKPSPFAPVTPAAANPEPVERPSPVPEPAPPPPPASPTAVPPPVSAEPDHVTPATPEVSAPPAPQPRHVTLNAGLPLPVRLVAGLSSERNAADDVFLATLDKELVVDGFVIAERGARVEGRVVAVDRGGRVRGVAALAVELTRLHTSDGQTVAIQTDRVFKHAEAGRQEDATKVAGGAIIGAVIGAIAGGGKGAAIDVGVGGGAGAGDVLLTRGQPAELPSEARLTFHLQNPAPLTERLR